MLAAPLATAATPDAPSSGEAESKRSLRNSVCQEQDHEGRSESGGGPDEDCKKNVHAEAVSDKTPGRITRSSRLLRMSAAKGDSPGVAEPTESIVASPLPILEKCVLNGFSDDTRSNAGSDRDSVCSERRSRLRHSKRLKDNEAAPSPPAPSLSPPLEGNSVIKEEKENPPILELNTEVSASSSSSVIVKEETTDVKLPAVKAPRLRNGRFVSKRSVTSTTANKHRDVPKRSHDRSRKNSSCDDSTKDVYEFDEFEDCEGSPRALRHVRNSGDSAKAISKPSCSDDKSSSEVTPEKPTRGLKLTLRMKRSPMFDDIIEWRRNMNEECFEPQYEVLRVEGIDGEESSSPSRKKKKHKTKDREKRRRKLKEEFKESSRCNGSEEASIPLKRLRLILGNETRTIDIPSSAH